MGEPIAKKRRKTFYDEDHAQALGVPKTCFTWRAWNVLRVPEYNYARRCYADGNLLLRHVSGVLESTIKEDGEVSAWLQQSVSRLQRPRTFVSQAGETSDPANQGEGGEKKRSGKGQEKQKQPLPAPSPAQEEEDEKLASLLFREASLRGFTFVRAESHLACANTGGMSSRRAACSAPLPEQGNKSKVKKEKNKKRKRQDMTEEEEEEEEAALLRGFGGCFSLLSHRIILSSSKDDERRKPSQEERDEDGENASSSSTSQDDDDNKAFFFCLPGMCECEGLCNSSRITFHNRENACFGRLLCLGCVAHSLQMTQGKRIMCQDCLQKQVARIKNFRRLKKKKTQQQNNKEPEQLRSKRKAAAEGTVEEQERESEAEEASAAEDDASSPPLSIACAFTSTQEEDYILHMHAVHMGVGKKGDASSAAALPVPMRLYRKATIAFLQKYFAPREQKPPSSSSSPPFQPSGGNKGGAGEGPLPLFETGTEILKSTCLYALAYSLCHGFASGLLSQAMKLQLTNKDTALSSCIALVLDLCRHSHHCNRHHFHRNDGNRLSYILQQHQDHEGNNYLESTLQEMCSQYAEIKNCDSDKQRRGQSHQGHQECQCKKEEDEENDRKELAAQQMLLLGPGFANHVLTVRMMLIRMSFLIVNWSQEKKSDTSNKTPLLACKHPSTPDMLPRELQERCFSSLQKQIARCQRTEAQCVQKSHAFAYAAMVMHSNNSADDNENENQLEQEMQEEGAALSPTAVQKKGDTLQLVTLLPSANEEFVDRDLLYCKQHFWGVSTKTAGVAKQDMSREEMARIKFQQFVTQLLESKALKVLASCFSGGAPSSVVSTAAAPFFSSSLEAPVSQSKLSPPSSSHTVMIQAAPFSSSSSTRVLPSSLSMLQASAREKWPFLPPLVQPSSLHAMVMGEVGGGFSSWQQWSSSLQSCAMSPSSCDARGLRPAGCADSLLPPLSLQSSMPLSCAMMGGEAAASRPSLQSLSESLPYAMMQAAREKPHLQQRQSSYAMAVLQQALQQQKPQQQEQDTTSTTRDEEIAVDVLHRMIAQQHLGASEEPVVQRKRSRPKKKPEAMATMGSKHRKGLEALVSSGEGAERNEKATKKPGTMSSKNLEKRLRLRLGSNNLTWQFIKADGDCLFGAVWHQLYGKIASESEILQLRGEVAAYLHLHAERFKDSVSLEGEKCISHCLFCFVCMSVLLNRDSRIQFHWQVRNAYHATFFCFS